MGHGHTEGHHPPSHLFEGALADVDLPLGGAGLDALRQVDVLADDGVLHPSAGADVTGEKGPGVDADAHVDGCQALLQEPKVEAEEGVLHLQRGLDGEEGVILDGDRGTQTAMMASPPNLSMVPPLTKMTSTMISK